MSYISIILTCICGIVVRVCESFSNSFQSYSLSIPACLMAWRKEVRFATIHNIVTQLKCAFHSAEAWTSTFLIFTQIRKQYTKIFAAITNLYTQIYQISQNKYPESPASNSSLIISNLWSFPYFQLSHVSTNLSFLK